MGQETPQSKWPFPVSWAISFLTSQAPSKNCEWPGPLHYWLSREKRGPQQIQGVSEVALGFVSSGKERGLDRLSETPILLILPNGDPVCLQDKKKKKKSQSVVQSFYL